NEDVFLLYAHPLPQLERISNADLRTYRVQARVRAFRFRETCVREVLVLCSDVSFPMIVQLPGDAHGGQDIKGEILAERAGLRLAGSIDKAQPYASGNVRHEAPARADEVIA